MSLTVKLFLNTKKKLLWGRTNHQFESAGEVLQYITMYEAGVSAKTAKGYLKIFDEQVIWLQSKVWSNL